MTEIDASQIDLCGHCLIEASAGTGKTYTITNLCLRLLLGRGQRPLAISQILILTFTNATANELKERVAKRIQETLLAFRKGTDDAFLHQLIEDSADPARDLKLLRAANQLMDEASIFTIHSFCTKVLKERAFESGVLFQQNQESEQDELLQQAAQDCFRNNLLTLEPDLRNIALKLWPNPEKLAQQLKPLILNGDTTIYPSGIGNFNAKELVRDAKTAKKAWLDENTADLIANSLDGRYQPKKRLKTSQEFWRNSDADLGSELWEIYSKNNLAKSALDDPPESNALQLIDQTHTKIAQLPAWLWYTMLIEVRRLVAGYKNEWHQMTVDDLLTLTARAIKLPGSRLCELLVKRWPVAMIDEFQDTDPVQYNIFSEIYQAEDRDASLLMIGDPKQAIYQFRGADVFTYMNARKSAANISTLTTNWRSTPALINATNLLFQKPGIFDSFSGITFEPARHAAKNADKQMTIAGQNLPPCQLCVAGRNGAMALDIALELMMDFAAEEVVRLLMPDSAAEIKASPISAGQIAFLVRRRKDAAAAKAALARRGIRSVYLSQESVMRQDTAQDLKLILDAVAEPTNDRAIRTALATRLMQATAEEIDALNQDLAYHHFVLEEFRDYHEMWRNRQLAAMLDKLMARRQLAEKWLHQPDGERQLTNLRHLAELLQERIEVKPGMSQLIKWFERQQTELGFAGDDARQLRLESDENLIKIVTMHAAKGLEYDIVMLPMPVFNRRTAGSQPALFHENHGGKFNTALELGSNLKHRESALSEQRAEEIRLLYVALTRARYRCYIGLPQVRNFAKSGIAALLGLEGFADSTNLSSYCAAELSAGRLPTDLFEQVDVVTPKVTTIAETRERKTIKAPPVPPAHTGRWQVHSYTSLISRIAETHFTTGYADDDPARNTQVVAEPSRFAFPRGPRVGIALHALLEELDFTDSAQLFPLCENTCRTLSLRDNWLHILHDWLKDILSSPLDSSYTLRDIDRANRLDELEFHFPLQSSISLVARLNELGYLRSRLIPIELEGMMTGLIDLVYRHNNQYFIIDYKSNFLGFQPKDYGAERLAETMLDQNYSLQLLIYAIALHRMLKHSLPGYDYEKHFGSVKYLFLRGMDGATGNGIYSHRPEITLITELDELLGETG